MSSQPSRRAFAGLGLAALAAPAWGQPPTADLAITNARIVDGSGGAAFDGAVLITRGRIAAVAPGGAKVRARRQLDAGGKVLAPGFVDAHAHGDPLTDRSFENFLSMGVTTVVLGQDGDTPGFEAPGAKRPSRTLSVWMRQVEAHGVEVNVAALSGHGSLRTEAGVGLDAVPGAVRQRQMEALLARDLAAGAFGLSSGLEYPPGLASETPELVGLARVVGGVNGVVMSHMRSEDDDKIDEAITEVLAQGGVARIHISHLKIVLGHGPEHARRILARLADARRDGVRVTADAYPYIAGFADISLVYPPWAKTKAQFDLAMRTRREELEAYVRRRIESRNGPEAILIAQGPLSGTTLKAAAEAAGKPFWVFALDDLGISGPSCAHFVQDAALQDVFLTSDDVTIATDGAPWMAHPRSWGTYPRFIEEYVVKRNALSLERAVAKMSALPARVVGLTDRGRIAPGYVADLVMFAPEKLHARSTWTEPRARAVGIDAVVVNGVIAYADGKVTKRKVGRVLRRGKL